MPREKYPVNYPLGLDSIGYEAKSASENFFRKVRRIDATNPLKPRTGFSSQPRDEKIRFRQIPHLHFAPSTIGRSENRYDEETEREFEEIMIYFMGLLGPSGPLPTVVSDVIIARAKGVPHPDMEEAQSGESAFRVDAGPAAFIDLFNHRFISFFYRAAVSSNKAVDFDRPEESRFRSFIGSFIGLGIPSCFNRMIFPDTAALYFSGHYACPTRHAEGLCAMVKDFCEVPARIEQNIGHWVEVPVTSHTILGLANASGGLGRGTMLGSYYWDHTMKFRIVLGPMSWDKFSQYEPGGEYIRAIASMVLLYCDREFICEINPVLRKNEVPQCRLGGGSRLGFSTWLQSVQPISDAKDLTLTLVS